MKPQAMQSCVPRDAINVIHAVQADDTARCVYVFRRRVFGRVCRLSRRTPTTVSNNKLFVRMCIYVCVCLTRTSCWWPHTWQWMRGWMTNEPHDITPQTTRDVVPNCCRLTVYRMVTHIGEFITGDRLQLWKHGICWRTVTSVASSLDRSNSSSNSSCVDRSNTCNYF